MPLLEHDLLGDIACLISSLLVGWELEVQTLFSSSGYPPHGFHLHGLEVWNGL